MRLLELNGFPRVAHYGPGIVGWRRANLPFDTGRERSIHPEDFPEPGAQPQP
ncbi:MAG: hypothetical protein QM765_10605 [Myxococcales bacterium]